MKRDDIKQRIFVVEDEPDNQKILQDILEFGGFEVLTAGSIQEAMTKLNTCQTLDLMLVDVHLPDGCGLSLLKSFREKFPVLGVLIVTAAAAPETRAQALDMGALKIIGKPFTAREILGEVTKVLGS